MQKPQYTTVCNDELDSQFIDEKPSAIEVAKRLGIGYGLLYNWIKKFKTTIKQ